MRKAIVVVPLVGLLVGVGCKEPAPPPSLTLELKAVSPEGEPLPGVSVALSGTPQGETNAEGKLSFSFTKEPGEEISLSARLDRPGLQFKPWEQALVIRKYDAFRPETMRYSVEARMEPQTLGSQILVQAQTGPAAATEIRIDGKALKTDSSGMVSVDLGTKMTRSAKLAVRLKGHEPYDETATLRAGETHVVALAKLGQQYGKVLAAYESMGRLIPVPDAAVTLGGQTLGRTDKAGSVRYPAPPKAALLSVRKEGFAPDPASANVPAQAATQIVVPLVPREAPVFRLVVQAPRSGSPGDRDIEGALPEIEERLADYLFSHPCFEKAESEAKSDVVVSTMVNRSPDGVVLSVRLAWNKGKTIAAFAETGKLTRIKTLSETVSTKILDAFPFEGHVLGFEEERVLTSLGSGRERGIRKGDAMTVYRWTATVPPKTTRLGKGVVKRVDADLSRLEMQAGATKPTIGDKVVLVPRATEAAFDAAVAITVVAGKEGAERPFADVNVYRDGVWVGATSSSGEIQVPASSGEKHVLLFVKGGIKPHQQEIRLTQALEPMTIRLPDTASRFRLESEPSGARTLVDDEDVGITPLETDVIMGFHRVKVDAGGDWRMFDKVMEFTQLEENYTGGRRVVLQKDVLKRAEAMIDTDVDGAVRILAEVQPGHPDFSAARHRLAGIYLDQKKDPQRAIAEFQRVLDLPENRELVNKRFAVTFLNMGRAYYQLGTADSYQRSISQLLVARDNKRFFPKEQHDRATHDTLYFLALATHKLYHNQQTDRLLRETSARWKDYFDFFPASLQDEDEVKMARAGAEQFYEEIRRKLRE